MSCFHPAFIQRKIKLVNGEVTTKYLGGIKNCIECNSVLREMYEGNKTLDFIPRTYQNGCAYDFIQIPCGKCIGCRIDYSRSWADRLTYHSIGRENCSYFLTLTYDDAHQSSEDYIPAYDIYTLNYEHMDIFIKRLRNKFRDAQIDYYYAGEYGDSSFRQHFHVICFNMFIPDLKFYKTNPLGDCLYTSEILDSLWGKGYVVIGLFNWRNAAYTARYVEKKRDGRAMIEYTALGLEPEKCRCSRRPGIAYDYYESNYQDIWKNNGLLVPRDVNSSGKLGIPRYFRRLAEEKEIGLEDFYKWRERSLNRQNILNPYEVSNSSFDLDHVREMLEFEERDFLSRKAQRNF